MAGEKSTGFQMCGVQGCDVVQMGSSSGGGVVQVVCWGRG